MKKKSNWFMWVLSFLICLRAVACVGGLFICLACILGWLHNEPNVGFDTALLGFVGLLTLHLYDKSLTLSEPLLRVFKKVVRVELRLRRLERSLNARNKDVSDH